mgnify:CR=1 FL=1
MSMLEVKDLVVSYGGIEALKGISFSVDEGQIVTLIGANGAGKSTTLRAITSLVPVKSGSIFYGGEDITRLDTQKTVERGIALVPEGRRVFANLTVLENLKIGAYLRKDKAEIAAKAAISSPLLETSISGANGILINITASPDIGLEDIDLASTMITNEASDNATVIWGASFDPELEDKMKITIIATGFANDKEKLPKMDAKAAAPAPAQEEKKAEVTAEENEFAPTEEEKNGELPEVEPSAISEDDFNELMGMLKKQKKL